MELCNVFRNGSIMLTVICRWIYFTGFINRFYFKRSAAWVIVSVVSRSRLVSHFCCLLINNTHQLHGYKEKGTQWGYLHEGNSAGLCTQSSSASQICKATQKPVQWRCEISHLQHWPGARMFLKYVSKRLLCLCTCVEYVTSLYGLHNVLLMA